MPVIRPATPPDLERVLALHRDFFAEDGYPFREEASQAAFVRLLAEPGLGRVIVLEDGAPVIAYVVLTFGFSIEFGGRDALVDELYVVPGHRGRGHGTRLLDAAAAVCREAGARAVHLVVERSKERVRALYRRQGFVAHARDIMTRRIDLDAQP